MITSGPNRVIRFYRIIDGKRMPCVMELSNDLVFIAERVDMRPSTNAVGTQQEDDTEKELIKKRQMTMARWCSRSIVENPIPGTDEYREKYITERRDLEERHRMAGTNCPQCEIGKLMLRYREILEKKGLLQ